ncbi:MAG: IS3 family transposase [Bacteroidota bacterium]
MIYGLIEELSTDHSVEVLCKVLGVSRSSYYSFVGGSSYVLSPKRWSIWETVRTIFEEHEGRYGSRRIEVELKKRGIIVGRDQVRRAMQAQDLVAIQPRSFVPKTTQDDPTKIRSPNRLLGREPLCSGIREVLVGDITYWPGKDHWYFLAVWMDLFSRRILGWSFDRKMETSLVLSALKKAMLQVPQPKGLIVHSDGGGQYKSHKFRLWLAQQQCLQSMTRKDNHYDNAFAESLFSRMKAELLDKYPYFSQLEEGKLRLFEYIETYYNTRRIHSSIGNMSPMEFEQQLNPRKERA